MGLNTTTRTGENVAQFVRRAFGDESSVQITDNDLLGWINDGIVEIAQKLKINRKRGFTDVVQDQGSYDFNGLNIIEIESLRVDGMVITSLEYQEAEEELFNTDPLNESRGRPKYWYVYENQVNLWPVPNFDSANGLGILYIEAPARLSALSDTLSIPDKYFNALNHYVLAQSYQLDENTEWFTIKIQQFTAALEGEIDEDKISSFRYFPSITETQDY